MAGSSRAAPSIYVGNEVAGGISLQSSMIDPINLNPNFSNVVEKERRGEVILYLDSSFNRIFFLSFFLLCNSVGAFATGSSLFTWSVFTH